MGVLKSLFSGPKLPKPQPVARLPDAQDPEAIEARRRKQAEIAQGKGRASTDLSGTYASDRLGV
jgi:hypothetical protein